LERRIAEYGPPQKIGLLRGTCFLIRKEALETIGLLDERYFLYFDEADLSARLKKSGFNMFFVHEANVYHQMSHSFSGKCNPKVLYYTTRNELLFAKKYLNMPLFIPFWVLRFLLRIVQYAAITHDTVASKAVIKGFLDFTNGKFGK
jgi:GT2 family glycosyltransferase